MMEDNIVIPEQDLEPKEPQRAERQKRQVAEIMPADEPFYAETDSRQDPQGAIDYKLLSKGSFIMNAFAKHALTDEQHKKLRIAYLKLKKYGRFLEDIKTIRQYTDKSCVGTKCYEVNSIISSQYDVFEQYPYVGTNVYKRAVKLVFKEGRFCVDVSHDKTIYGICTDIDEASCTAQVVPISSQFTGYLVCNNNTRLVATDILDFTSEGEVAKAVAPNLPAYIDMVALAPSFKIDLRTILESKDKDYKPDGDFIVSLVKVICRGNRSESKKN